MRRIANIIIVLFLFIAIAYSQNNITGTFNSLVKQQVKLEGFNGFETYLIDSTQTDEEGKFILEYSDDDYGMGYLTSTNNQPFIVVLCGEDIEFKGETLRNPETIQVIEGNQNKLFGQYASEHPRREQALSAWIYLEKIYQADSLFAIHKNPINTIKQEKQRIKKEDSAFLAGLNPTMYISWYIPVRKLAGSVSTIAQYRVEEIPATIEALRNIDYTDPRIYKSGLLRETIENHFWLIENSGRLLDSVYIEMKISIDSILNDLVKDEKKLNEITNYLFKLLESRSLFKASEYLALKILNEVGCTINDDLAARMESYRAMKRGNIAPNFDFEVDCLAPGYQPDNLPQKLSELKSDYTAVIFGASWCPQCSDELSQIAQLYESWETHKVEVVFVSLDEDREVFKSYAKSFPFISICDYKKWESPIVKNYFVFATPTIFLLDSKREILLRPNSVNHLDSWVDWFLVRGNM